MICLRLPHPHEGAYILHSEPIPKGVPMKGFRPSLVALACGSVFAAAMIGGVARAAPSTPATLTYHFTEAPVQRGRRRHSTR